MTTIMSTHVFTPEINVEGQLKGRTVTGFSPRVLSRDNPKICLLKFF